MQRHVYIFAVWIWLYTANKIFSNIFVSLFQDKYQKNHFDEQNYFLISVNVVKNLNYLKYIFWQIFLLDLN